MTRWTLVAAPACLAACSLFSPLPDARTPADRARELDPRCRDFAEGVTAGVLSPAAIDGVAPAYSYVPGGPNGREARLRGARIRLRPLAGVTKEILARTLECHEARVTLGTVAASANDPYVLPNRWLDIDVDSDGDAFVALVRIDAFDDAREVLERARRFVAARP